MDKVKFLKFLRYLAIVVVVAMGTYFGVPIAEDVVDGLIPQVQEVPVQTVTAPDAGL
jgi:hypothetical protein